MEMAKIISGFLCNCLLVRLDSNRARKDELKSRSKYSERSKVRKPCLVSELQKNLS